MVCHVTWVGLRIKVEVAVAVSYSPKVVSSVMLVSVLPLGLYMLSQTFETFVGVTKSTC